MNLKLHGRKAVAMIAATSASDAPLATSQAGKATAETPSGRPCPT
jgi:hypothetical protein